MPLNLSTHSPVVLDQVGEAPERIFVMEPDQPELPIPPATEPTDQTTIPWPID